jgi:hypothetical protein
MFTRASWLPIAIALLWPFGAMAQAPSPAPAPATSQQQLSAGEIDALVAPIALYPDNLLSQVLMASTFPLQVVHAERWLQANKKLTGTPLQDAVAKHDWDDSVKSLVATPSVLEMMSTKLDWTQKLGNAVLAQQTDVMDAIQRLRTKAQANNSLQSTKEQNVTVSQSEGKQVIAIAPTDPGTVYVPYYNPSVVYGSWPYPAYPPYYWPPPGYIAGGIIATGIAFGAGYALGRWASGGYWGGSVNWNNNNITINRPGGGGGNWDRGARVEHRGGNRGNRQMDFRGRNGQQVLNPGNRGNAGNRASTLPAGGNRGERAKAGTRQGANRAQHRAAGGASAAKARPHASHRAGGAGGARARAGGGGGRAAVGGGHRGGGGGHRAGGGGGHRGGGGGHRGGGGGGRRSDIRLKHDIVLVGRLSDGLGLYRFVYNGGHKAYVGVIAQEVQQVVPQAVERRSDGYLRVHYDQLGLKFESYRRWVTSGSRLPVAAGTGL